MSPGEFVGQAGQLVDPLGKLTILILVIGLLVGVAAVSFLFGVILQKLSRLERRIEAIIAQKEGRPEAATESRR